MVRSSLYGLRLVSRSDSPARKARIAYFRFTFLSSSGVQSRSSEGASPPRLFTSASYPCSETADMAAYFQGEGQGWKGG